MGDYFDDLEEEINKVPKNIESVAFETFEEKAQNLHLKKRSSCWHNQKTLDDDSRMVKCDQCGAYLDVYDSLKRIVSDREMNSRNRKRLLSSIDELAEREKALKLELKSLDGKIKRRKNNLK